MKDKIKFGVIGCGRWGYTHCKIYKNYFYSSLVAVCDMDEKRAKLAGREFSVNWYTDYYKMLENEDLDAVGIATPDFVHAGPIIAAAKYKKDILCEKPVVTDESELERVIEAVNSSKVRIMVDYHNRWDVPFVLTKQNIVKGELGRPINAYVRLNDNISVPMGYISWAEKSSVLWFLGSHCVDLLVWLFDDRIKRVYSVSKKEILKSKGINCVDMYLSTLEFENGGIAQLENGWVTPNGHPCLFDFKFNILCSKGMVNIDLTDSNFYQVYFENSVGDTDFTVNPTVHDALSGFAIESIKDFVNRLYKNEEFIVKFEESIAVNKVIFAILKSANSREPIVVNY